MRMSNVVMLAVALVCATAAALLTRAWLVRLSAQSPAPAETAAPMPTRSLVVAARDLRYGDKLTAGSVKLVAWPAGDLPRGAFLSIETLLGASGSRTVTMAMGQGEPVLQQKLLGGGAANALPAKLSERMKAVTIRVNDVAGVAGFVQPEDRVDVFLTYSEKPGGPEGAAQTASAIVVLLQNIRVLAVDQVTERKEQPTPAKAVTLEVSTEEAQKLTLAGQVGQLSLALNRIAASGEPEKVAPVAFEDLKNDGQGLRNKNKPGGPIVTVTRSTESKSYQVQPEGGRDESWQGESTSFYGHLNYENGQGAPRR
jgi:pilus assembly protein CpaB